MAEETAWYYKAQLPSDSGTQVAHVLESAFMKPRLGKRWQDIDTESAEKLGWTNLHTILSDKGSDTLHDSDEDPLVGIPLAYLATHVNIQDALGLTPVYYAIPTYPAR